MKNAQILVCFYKILKKVWIQVRELDNIWFSDYETFRLTRKIRVCFVNYFEKQKSNMCIFAFCENNYLTNCICTNTHTTTHNHTLTNTHTHTWHKTETVNCNLKVLVAALAINAPRKSVHDGEMIKGKSSTLSPFSSSLPLPLSLPLYLSFTLNTLGSKHFP